MSRDSTEFEIAPVLQLAARARLARMEKRLADLGFDGLTPAIAALMPLLDPSGTKRATALAREAGVTRQAMSQLVRLLEERGHVEQVADESDSRAKMIRLTKQGVALRKACETVRKELQDEAAKALGRKDLARLHRGLKKFISAMASDEDG